MDLIHFVSHFFLLALALGNQACYPIVNPALTGAGYVRLTCGVSAGSLVVALMIAIVAGVMTPLLWGLYLGELLALTLMYFLHKDRRSWGMWGLYDLQLLFFLAIAHLHYSGPSLVNGIYFILTVALLGIVNYAMVLGHYYLVVPRLTERPLIILHYLFWPAIALKMGLSIYAFVNGASFFEEGTELGMGYMFNWIMLTMRVLWGYVALLVLSYFSYRLCRMRSIQSATGVLYIMVFFVFVGELVSHYLFFKLGMAV